MRGVVRASGMFSGGTFHSAMTAVSPGPADEAGLGGPAPRSEPRPEGRSSRAVAGKPHRDPVLGYWLLPLPTIDPIVVARSGAALASYGPKFRYSHYAGTKTLRYAVGGAAGVGALGRGRPGRAAAQPAAGPDQAGRGSRREPAGQVVVHASTSSARAAASRCTPGCRGGDPGYTETAKMLAESALCLALDDNPPTAGQVTTAQAMGDNLLARLQKAGIVFEVVD